MNDDKNLFEDTNIDYSDGIGDLLKDKDKYEFSWKKTGTVVVGLMIALAISVAAVSKIAKAIIIPEPETYQSFEFSPESQEEGVEHIGAHSHDHNEINDDDLVNEIEKLLVTNEDKKEPVKQQTVKSETQVKPVQNNSETISQQAPVASTKKVEPVTRSVNRDALYRVVIGKFNDKMSANTLLKRLRADNQSSYVWRNTEESQNVFRVQVGAFAKESSAKTLKNQLSRRGYNPYILHK